MNFHSGIMAVYDYEGLRKELKIQDPGYVVSARGGLPAIVRALKKIDLTDAIVVYHSGGMLSRDERLDGLRFCRGKVTPRGSDRILVHRENVVMYLRDISLSFQGIYDVVPVTILSRDQEISQSAPSAYFFSEDGSREFFPSFAKDPVAAFWHLTNNRELAPLPPNLRLNLSTPFELGKSFRV